MSQYFSFGDINPSRVYIGRHGPSSTLAAAFEERRKRATARRRQKSVTIINNIFRSKTVKILFVKELLARLPSSLSSSSTLPTIRSITSSLTFLLGSSAAPPQRLQNLISQSLQASFAHLSKVDPQEVDSDEKCLLAHFTSLWDYYVDHASDERSIIFIVQMFKRAVASSSSPIVHAIFDSKKSRKFLNTMVNQPPIGLDVPIVEEVINPLLLNFNNSVTIFFSIFYPFKNFCNLILPKKLFIPVLEFILSPQYDLPYNKSMVVLDLLSILHGTPFLSLGNLEKGLRLMVASFERDFHDELEISLDVLVRIFVDVKMLLLDGFINNDSVLSLFANWCFYLFLLFPSSTKSLVSSLLFSERSGIAILVRLFKICSCWDYEHVPPSSYMFLFWISSTLFSHTLNIISNDELENFPPSFPKTLVENFVKTSCTFSWNLLTLSCENSLLMPEQPEYRVLEALSDFLHKFYARNIVFKFVEPEFWTHFSKDLVVSSRSLDPSFKLFQAVSENSQSMLRSQIDGKLMILFHVLKWFKFFLPFDFRVLLFQRFLEEVTSVDLHSRYINPRKIAVRRGFEYDDLYEYFLKDRRQFFSDVFYLQIEFIDYLGMREAGIDGGGLMNELLAKIFERAFNPTMGLFLQNSTGEWYPNPHQYLASKEMSDSYMFLGNMVALAISKHALLPVVFADFFLKKLCGMPLTIDDIQSLDPELHRTLLFLKNFDDVSSLDLTFSIDNQDIGGTVTLPLVPGGESIPVTPASKFSYILHVIHHKLNVQLQRQTLSFLNGVFAVLPKQLFVLFSSRELGMLLSGSSLNIDIDDWEANTVYNGYTANDLSIALFWQYLRSLETKEVSEVLAFCIGYPRAPLRGFKALSPNFCIARSQHPESHFPTSSTCSNMLVMPAYSSISVLSEKFTYVLKESPGFNLA